MLRRRNLKLKDLNNSKIFQNRVEAHNSIFKNLQFTSECILVYFMNLMYLKISDEKDMKFFEIAF